MRRKKRDRRWVNAQIPLGLHKKIRALAYEEGLTLPDMVQIGLAAYVRMRERKMSTLGRRETHEKRAKGVKAS